MTESKTPTSGDTAKISTADGTKPSPNGKRGGQQVISHPNDVAQLVLMQIDAVNARKDELGFAIKQLADTAKQLVRAYGANAKVIATLQKRIHDLEARKDGTGVRQ